MSTFLENLKKAVEKGEFNSEAAKKIIELNELADNVKSTRTLDNAIEIANESGAIKSVTEEEAAVLNLDYENKMEEIKLRDAVNQQLATLIQIEDMVKLSIEDMYSFIDEINLKFSEEFKKENPIFADLSSKLEEIQAKYNVVINK